MDLDATTPEFHADGLTTFLFRLPAELRVEIYNLCLPANRHFLDVFADNRELQWLATSRAIFQDASPLVYGKTGIYFDLEPHAPTRQGNVEPAFFSHIQTTFEKDKEWIAEFIRVRLVKKVMIEVWCSFFDNIGDLTSWLTSTAAQLGRFVAMEELCISIRDQFIGPKDESVLPVRNLQQDEPRRNALRGSTYLRQICWTTRRMKSELPVECEVRWSLPGEVLPEVSFLRLNAPEQAPSEKERTISQFMETVWLFITLQPRELLLAE